MIRLKEENIYKLLETRNCVFFVGSAISMKEPSCLPDGYNLKKLVMESLCRDVRHLGLLFQRCFPISGLSKNSDRLSQSMSELMPEVIFQIAQDIIGGHAKKALKFCEFAKYNSNHECLAYILKRNKLLHGKALIITTNFDCLLERAMENIGLVENKDFQVHSTTDKFSISKDNVIDMFKLHGTIQNETTVATTLREVGLRLPSKKADVLKFILENFTVLFVGYSGCDLDIYPIISECNCKEICWLIKPKLKPKLQAESIIAKFNAKVCKAELSEFFMYLNRVYNFGIQERPVKFDDDFVSNNIIAWSKKISATDKAHIVANVMRHIGELMTSVQLLEKVRVSSRHTTALLKKVKRLNDLGAAYTDINNWQGARKVYEESLNISQDIGHNVGIGISKGGIALCFYKQDAWNKAIALYNESLDLLENSRAEERDILRIKIGLGLTYHKQKLTDKAIEYLEPILEPVSNITDVQTLIQARRILGLAYYRRAKGEDLEKALAQQNEAMQLSIKIEDDWGIVQATNNIGQIYRKQHKLDEAIECHRSNLPKRERLQDMRGAGQTLYNLGRAYTDKAIESYQKSVDYYRKVESQQTQDLLASYEKLGKLFLSSNEFEESIRHFSISLKNREQMLDAGEEDPHYLADVLGELGHAYLLSGEASRAIGQYDRMLKIYSQMSQEDLDKFTGSSIERYENAKRHLKTALGIFAIMRDTKRIRDFSNMIDKIDVLRRGV